MKKFLIIVTVFLLVGCAQQSSSNTTEESSTFSSLKKQVMDAIEKKESAVQLPVDNYLSTYKRFGEYFQDRFRGYHVGDDSEVVDVTKEVPVYAVANGIVKRADTVSGYGGVVIVEHRIEDETATAIYGHLDISSSELASGATLSKGQFLTNLGDDASQETDGERKHLHFALYVGAEDGRLQGYEREKSNVDNWINPHDFFAQYGIAMNVAPQTYNALIDPQGKKIFNLDFEIPAGWDVEYIPSLQALNLYAVAGAGTARDRSQILIRYFDASQFLTLNTVTIHNTQDLTVGKEGYDARRYDIEKKPLVGDFKDQPSWRNKRHIVTDFRKTSGRTRYFVVAANPVLDPAVYEQVLASMTIL